MGWGLHHLASAQQWRRSHAVGPLLSHHWVDRIRALRLRSAIISSTTQTPCFAPTHTAPLVNSLQEMEDWRAPAQWMEGQGQAEHSPSPLSVVSADSGSETRTPTLSVPLHSIARTGDRQHATGQQACGRHSASPATTEHSTPSAVSRGFFCRVGVAERNQKR